MKSLLHRILNRHKWEQLYKFVSNNKSYGHEHYYCPECGLHKHTKRFWNRKVIVKFYQKQPDK